MPAQIKCRQFFFRCEFSGSGYRQFRIGFNLARQTRRVLHGIPCSHESGASATHSCSLVTTKRSPVSARNHCRDTYEIVPRMPYIWCQSVINFLLSFRLFYTSHLPSLTSLLPSFLPLHPFILPSFTSLLPSFLPVHPSFLPSYTSLLPSFLYIFPSLASPPPSSLYTVPSLLPLHPSDGNGDDDG